MDTMEANNFLSNPVNLKKQKYHVVSMQWFRRAHPILKSGEGTRESIGLIHNDRLHDYASYLVCSQFQHGVDYVLVGPNVWLLLKQKFGFDTDIKLPLIHSAADGPGSRVYVQLTACASTPIPLSGRFPYENYLEALGNNNNNNDTVVSDDPTVGEEDEDDELPIVERDTFANDQIVLLPPPRAKPTLRLYGSGLGNLGNTCFMNSTLQCLAHTEPLKVYFLSGEYRDDLNTNNPLGTGGDLATEFSSLLGEMWTGDKPVVYPRQFKMTLGKHAEQFVGYDQHDSQELATYLLDALHEDCNRVTRKPYFEKPEQGADESDEDAASKAWNLHLQRDDSRVLHNFMGQIKSRLECPHCSRVSTTFDPFMYLSVPVPGSENRTMRIHYIPLDPRLKPIRMDITIAKLASIDDLVTAAMGLRKSDGFAVPKSSGDIAVIDVFSKEAWAWLKLESSVDIIKESDTTFVFELSSDEPMRTNKTNGSADKLNIEPPPSNTGKLDIGTLTRLNSVHGWLDELNKYLISPVPVARAMHPKRGTTEDKVRFYRQLTAFIQDCYGVDSQKRTRDEMEETTTVFIDAACRNSTHFKEVKSETDLAILKFIARKLHNEILRRSQESVLIEVKLRKAQNVIGEPFVIRISSETTVFQLRHIVYERFQRCLAKRRVSAGEPTGETSPPTTEEPTNIIMHLPLSYECQKPGNSRSLYHSKRTLGCILAATTPVDADAEPSPTVADPDLREEQALVASLVGNEGKVFLEFDEDTIHYFDENEYNSFEERPLPPKEDEESKTLSVYDCIEKYCQREQLEESEQWYCSQCKERVCAWKQFQIFRSPPILIVHLKRFQFSASSHRRQKIGTFIDFPLEGLDLSNHVTHWEGDEQPIYDCYAVSNHFGGLGGGHYTAYAVNKGKVWCNYDDSRISEDVDPSEVVSNAAYVLYYRRRDVPVEKEFEIDLTTPENLNTKMPAVISDTYPRSSPWDATKRFSANAAMVDDEDEDMDNRSTQSYGAVARGASPIEIDNLFDDANDDGRDLENQYDASETENFLEQ